MAPWLMVILLLCSIQPGRAQEYPYWFYNQAGLRCGAVAVGYTIRGFLADSAATRAMRNGHENFARYQATQFEGGHTFWSTELGMLWMSSNLSESFDSTAVERAARLLAPADTFMTEDMVCVLLASSGCSVERWYRDFQSPEDLPSPSWVHESSNDPRYFHAVGMAPLYFHETSSWLQAEEKARINLARQVHTQTRAVQKSGYDSQEILEENTSVVLHNMEVAARWRDMQKEIVYVLLRVAKQNVSITLESMNADSVETNE